MTTLVSTAIDTGLAQGMSEPKRLRELAWWYREFAERAANTMIWEARLLTAENLDREADQIEQNSVANRQRRAGLSSAGK
jgi:hypothetical protein